MSKSLSFFAQRQKLLALLAALYVVLLILSHATLPSGHVWGIAVVFSIVMNGVYLTEARSLGAFVRTETVVGLTLIGLSLVGLAQPLAVIAAIFLHGCWDVAKHRGAGVPFFNWYTLSCFAVDTFYSGALLLYWIRA